VLLKPKAVEMSFGVLDGLLPETARRLYPEAWALHRRQPTRLAALGGEDWRDVEQRARQVLDELPAAPTCILVAHQLFFSALLGTIGLVPPPLGYAQTLLLQRHVGSGWRCAT
jgi:broad specificity phosphatase PhoE